MEIKDYLQKKKDPEGYLAKTMSESIMRAFDTFKEFVVTRLGELETRLNNYAPIPGEKGEDGSDYIITEQDYKQIAQLVEVPVVEKVIEKTETVIREIPGETIREIVREMPTVTEVVREVALTDSGEKIVEKLNTTTESVDMSVIKGLRDVVEKIKREVSKKSTSGGGSGMGNIQHETKNTSSATTTVTTNYPISNGGYGIIGAYYQSAFIVRGEHYTVGGDRKTLTLLFTPEDNTKIDLVYVR